MNKNDNNIFTKLGKLAMQAQKHKLHENFIALTNKTNTVEPAKLPNFEIKPPSYENTVFKDMAEDIKENVSENTAKQIDVLVKQLDVQSKELIEAKEAVKVLKKSSKSSSIFSYIAIIISFLSLLVSIYAVSLSH